MVKPKRKTITSTRMVTDKQTTVEQSVLAFEKQFGVKELGDLEWAPTTPRIKALLAGTTTRKKD